MLWILFVLLIVGLLVYFHGKSLDKRRKERQERISTEYPYANFNFPETDSDGNAFQRTYTFELTGSHIERDGKNPQKYVTAISPGDPVFFKHMDVSDYPDAYYAFDMNDNPLGWLPENSLNRDTVVRRLDRNLTVLCCAKNTDSYTTRDNEEYISLIVEVAVYALPKKS